MVFIGIALITSMAVIYFHINKKYPVTYEDCVMQVVDKREEKLIGIQEKQLFLLQNIIFFLITGKNFVYLSIYTIKLI